MMETHATELTRVGEDQRAFALIQDQVIVFGRMKIRRREVDFAGHAEMKAEPVVAGKFKQHSFAARRRSQQFLADQLFAQSSRVGVAENSFSRMQLHIGNLVANAGVPLFAIPFDFGQLRHRAK